MTRDQIEERLVKVLRASALSGSTREIEMDAPLGEEGVGLDSLALVQFLVALETEYKVRLPVDFWARADQMSLSQCGDFVAGPGGHG